MGRPPLRYGRRYEKGAVAVEIMLSLPVIFVAFSGAIFVTQFMKQRAVVEQAVVDAAHHCARYDRRANPPDSDAWNTCVTEQFTAGPAARLCNDPRSLVTLVTKDATYDDEELHNDVTIELAYLTIQLECAMEVDVPMLDLGELTFQCQTAMPIRRGTDLQP
ncbi:MAG: TadE/TadG family type IV pilus assembly protein [Bradymonadia bacterium]